MYLNRESGHVDGKVKSGTFAGRNLSSLALGELLDLLREVRLSDNESIALVEAYLDRSHADWREIDDAPGDDVSKEGDEEMSAARALGYSRPGLQCHG